MKNQKNNSLSFEGFKGEIFNEIKNAGQEGVTFEALQKKFVSKLLDEDRAVGGGNPNLHGTLQVLKNGGNVNVKGEHTPTFQKTDVFYVK